MDILRQTSSTRENLGMLAVMEALEDREEITQRELAQVTGLNLKKVNYCLHKLLEKGHVKFQRVRKNPDKRAYLYILTPAGMRAKSQLTYRFLRFTLDFYSKMEAKLQKGLDELMEAGVQRVLLFGASDAARILLGMIDERGPEVVGIVDDSKDERDFYGVTVVKTHQIRSLDWDAVLITVLEDLEDAEARLRGAGISQKEIWELP